MPSTIVLAYAYRSDYLARCLALDTSRSIRPLARSFARSSINALALPVFYLKRLRRAVSRARSVQCVPAIIGRREILVIEDANTCTCIASRKKRARERFLLLDQAECRNLNTCPSVELKWSQFSCDQNRPSESMVVENVLRIMAE